MLISAPEKFLPHEKDSFIIAVRKMKVPWLMISLANKSYFACFPQHFKICYEIIN